MKRGNWVVVIVALCCVFVALGLDLSNEETRESKIVSLSKDDITNTQPVPLEHPESILLVVHNPTYDYTIKPMGEVVDAEGTPIENPKNGDIMLHNMRVMQEMIERHERMYQLLIDKFGCKTTSRVLGCFKE